MSGRREQDPDHERGQWLRADHGSAVQSDADSQQAEREEARATRNLWHGLIALVVLVAMFIGLLVAVPSLESVENEILHMPIGWVLLGVGCEVMSCVGYIVVFLMVFDRVPFRFGARVALSEMAFGAAVALGGAGSVAVGAWLLIERGARPSRVAERSAVLFLLTSGVNMLTLAAAGLGTWFGLLPGKHDALLTLLPGAASALGFLAILALPWVTERFIADRHSGRVATWACAMATTIRTTARLLFSADWRLIGAYAYLWFDIAVLWLCFKATGHPPPLGALIIGYQIGYLSNLIPIPGGIGVLDGSFVGLFVLFGINGTVATSATIVYHAISLWIPATWGTISFVLLRRSRHQPIHWRQPRVRRERTAEE